MKQFFTLLLYAAIIGVTSANVFSQDSRRILFNDNWQFHKGDWKDAFQPEFNSSSWRNVTLPHDWSIEGPFSDQWASGTGYLPAGIGWYRKQFDIPATLKGKNLYLYFDGVYKNSEVWINGKWLGKRPNGYTSFYYDITPYLLSGKPNVVAVRVDHTDFADSRWYTGSGINRNVYLIPADPVHIGVWGVQFVTPVVNALNAESVVALQLKNTSGKKRKGTARVELLDASSKVAASAQVDFSLHREEGTVNARLNVQNPRLWSPDYPYLYTLRIILESSGKTVDRVEESVGFRFMDFDSEKGFSLNGKSMKLKGVCFHDDAGALGSAVPENVWERRLTTLKEMGCNSIRMSHNPHQDYIYALCDRMGFIVQDEAFDEWEVGKNKWISGWNVGTPGKDGYNKDFKEWADRDIRDMILRNRNRVSIAMWSIGNEIDYPNDPYTHEVLNTGRNPQIYGRGYQPGYPPAKRLGEIAKQLVSVVKKTDTTRYVTAALAGVVMSNTTEYPEALDIVGYNYQEYRYQDDHKEFPSRIIYGSENGKSSEAWMAVSDNEFISGQYLWTAFDFLGEARAWPFRSSGAGLIDMAGFPKPQFYHRKSLWTNDPVLFVGVTPKSRSRGGEMVSHWNWNEGDSLRVTCFTNLSEVDLFLNGVSLGKKSDSDGDNMLTWDVLYTHGTLEATAGRLTEAATRFVLKTTGHPVMIKATSDKQKIAGGGETAHIEVEVLDAEGAWVGNAENEIEIVIHGPGKLVGMESGSLSSHEDYKSNKRKCVNGKVLAYIQRTGNGPIKAILKSSNLKSYEIQIGEEQHDQ